MRKVTLLFSIIPIPAGIFLTAYGENDDSPGAVLLGVMAVVSGIFFLINYFKDRRAK